MEQGDHEQKLIQQQMEVTRASLSNKIEALENQVADTVQTATDVMQNTTDAVADTVESVKETVGEISDKVGDTVRSVADAFDLRRQVEERPWLVFGGAIGLGCLVGWYLPSRTRQRNVPETNRSFAGSTPTASTYEAAAAPPEAKTPGWVSNQVSRLRGLAIGMVMGSIRDLAVQSLPDAISTRVAEEVDNLTPHLGGEVIHGPILPDLELRAEGTAEERRNDAGDAPASFHPAVGEKAQGRALVGEWG
jgi:ElaB/YqjD/DUF883 family membrane-anchored ribosome-binding protein